MNCRSTIPKLALVIITSLSCGSLDAREDQPSNPPAQREIRVLGIGNSFTGNAFALLQPMGTRSEKCRIVLGQGIIGGCSMEKHMRLAKLHEAEPDNADGKPYAISVTDEDGKQTRRRVGLRELLGSDDWDIVTIQQLSAQSPDIDNYRPYAKELYDYIKKYAPQTEVVMHQTWAYRTDGDFDRVFPDKPSYGQKDMYRDLNAAYNTIAEELDVRLIPVGAAFQLAREIRPYRPDTTTDPATLTPPELPRDKNSLCAGWYWDNSNPPKLRCDTHHAGIQGKYLAAAVWFEFLTGLNPYEEGIQTEAVSDEDAKFLAGIAHKVVSEGERPSAGKVTANDFKAATFEGLPYRLYVPESYDSSKRYPLVLFLHGAGERGSDNLRQLTGQPVSMTFAQPESQLQHPCFVLAPQCPPSDQWVRAPWKSGTYVFADTPISDPLATVMRLLSELEEEYCLDEDRLYVTGLSMGGYGTWDLICRYPDRFAAAVPVCGGVDASQAERVAHVPLRIFHGDADTAVLPDGDRAMARALAQIGARDALYKEYHTGHGGCWMMAYAEPKLGPWLFQQKRQQQSRD